MQTVNFPCSHCGNLMGVGADLLGRQVRCPTCKQVVQAPAAPPIDPVPVVVAPPPPSYQTAGTGAEGGISFQVPPPREDDSIFAAPEASDDLFDDAPKALLEMPAEPGWPNLQIENPNAQSPTIAGHPPVAALQPPPSGPAPGELPGQWPGAVQPVVEIAAPAVPPGPANQWSTTSEAPQAAGENAWQGSTGAGQETELAPDPTDGASTRFMRRQPAKSGMGTIMILIFLVPYAILATAAAVYFYYLKQMTPHPLEVLPDSPGETSGANRKGQSSRVYKRWDPEKLDLPASLRVMLGKPIRVGDLEVTPQKVERRPVVFCYENAGREDQPSADDALVLTLRLRNLSADDYFDPTDPAFERLWRKGVDTDSNKPYTRLEVGKERFYGGACRWVPRARIGAGRRGEDPREYIQGQENDMKVLKPGEERTTVVTTDPENPDVLKALGRYQGPLLWRVQLRRGLVQVRDREVPASAVIGVEFKAGDVQAGG